MSTTIARAVPAEKHGTWSGYSYWKCRCSPCVQASKDYAAARRAGTAPPKSVLVDVQPAEHGTRARYIAGCRCDGCREAASTRRRPLGVPSTIRRYRYRITPSPAAQREFGRVFGGARFVYNAYVAAARDLYAAEGRHLNGFDGCKQIITAGRRAPETAWMAELPSSVLRASLLRAADGYRAFFESCSGKRKGPRMRPPKFKKRSSRQAAEFSRGSFGIRGGWENTAPGGGRLRLAKIGLVAVNWHRPLLSEPSAVTIVREADGSWWATFVVEVPKRATTPVKPGRIAGVDVGLTDYAAIVYSDGTREKIANPRFLRTAERKLARAQRNLSRKARGSNNRAKARVQVARVHARVADLRLNHARQLASRLIRENQAVVVEQLNIRGMAGGSYAKSINDVGWGVFFRALIDGGDHTGREIVLAPRNFPSTRTCSVCGTNAGPKPTSVREWDCECGARLDRDFNAATNLMMLAARSAESRNACGRDVRHQPASATGAAAVEAGTRQNTPADRGLAGRMAVV